MSKPIASVVIPAHDAETTLSLQLSALAAQQGAPDFEVLVVANNCSDGTARSAEDFADRLHVRVIVANDKPSAAYARNVGASNAAGSFILFCDADDQVSSRWVAEMVKPLESGEADFVGGRIDVNRQGLPDWIYEWRYEVFDQQCLAQADDHLPFTMSASLGVTASAFRAVGGFDESFAGAGAEEIDLCWRLLRASYRIGEAPDAAVLYEPRRTLRSVLRQVRGYTRGGCILEAKEGRLPSAPPSARASVLLTAKVSLARVFWKREFRPHVVYATTCTTYYRFEERRLHQDLMVKALPTDFDFFVPASVPLIGRRAFAVDNLAEVRWYHNGGVGQMGVTAIDRYLPVGGVFVDVGANVGAFSVAAAMRVGTTGRVVAFEPSERTRSSLETNLDRHGVAPMVEVRSEAVGSVRETRTFWTYENGLLSGFGLAPSSCNPGQLVDEPEVEVVTLSEAVPASVDMIKIDVQGFEADVLEGARALIQRSPSVVIVVALNPRLIEAAGRRVAEIFEALSPDEWTFHLLDEGSRPYAGRRPQMRGASPSTSDELPSFDPVRWSLADHGPDWHANILVIRRNDEHLRSPR